MARADTTDDARDDRSVTRSRKAFARRQWSRRWLTWRYVVAAVVMLALVVGGVWLVFFSRVLAVGHVEVVGEADLTEQEVRTAATIPSGEPLARLDLQAIRLRVESLALVRSAEVTRKWPDTVVVDVQEREPVAVVEIGGELRGLDVDGVVFQRFRSQPARLPRVELAADPGQDALREAAAVVTALPGDLAGKVDHVEVGSVDQISLVLRDDRTVIWGSAEQSELKGEVLAALLERPGSTYDVSVPGQPTVRP